VDGHRTRFDLRIKHDDGTPKEPEFDLFTGKENHLEAKSGGSRKTDLLDKAIRNKALQLKDEIASSGTIIVVGRPGEFTYSGRDKLRKVGKFIENSEGITKDELE
jgi:hypothetical protein